MANKKNYPVDRTAMNKKIKSMRASGKLKSKTGLGTRGN